MPIVTCPACATPLEIPEELVGRAVHCGNCSKPFEAMPNAPAGDFPASGFAETPLASPGPVSTRPFEEPEDYADFRGVRRDLVPHRGTLHLVLGIVSIVLTAVFCAVCGLFNIISLGLGITVWVMARNDLKKIDAGTMDRDGRGQTQAGQICAIVGSVLSTVILLIYGGIAVFYLVMLVAANKQGW